jgi:hypothetical protein
LVNAANPTAARAIELLAAMAEGMDLSAFTSDDFRFV